MVCYPNGSILICRRAQVPDGAGKYAWSVLQVVDHATGLGLAKVLSLQGESFASFGGEVTLSSGVCLRGHGSRVKRFVVIKTAIVHALQ